MYFMAKSMSWAMSGRPPREHLSAAASIRALSSSGMIPPPEDLGRGESGEHRGVAPPLPDHVQMGQPGQDGRGRLVAALDDKGAVVVVPLHLVDQHLGHGVAGLEGIAHPHHRLGRGVADDRQPEDERHAALFPDPVAGQKGCLRGRRCGPGDPGSRRPRPPGERCSPTAPRSLPWSSPGGAGQRR